MDTHDEPIPYELMSKAEQEAEAAAIIADLQAKNLQITVTERLTSEYDDIDSRQNILFIGQYSILCALLCEFWSKHTIIPSALIIDNNENLYDEQITIINDYIKKLKQNEVNEYTQKVIDAGHDHVTGDLEKLPLNSKPNITGDNTIIQITHDKCNNNTCIEQIRNNNPHIIVILDTPYENDIIKQLPHDIQDNNGNNILRLQPQLDITNTSDNHIDDKLLTILSDFVRELPDVLAQILM